MASCVRCNASVDESGPDLVKCSKCGDVYHYACAGIDNSKKPTRKKAFRCSKCSGSSSLPSNSDSEDSSGSNLQILKAIAGLKMDFHDTLESKLESMEKKISNKMENSFATIRNEMNQWKLSAQKSIDSLKCENTTLSEKCKVLDERVKTCELQINELNKQMRDTQQYSRLSNIEICGVPFTANEDVYMILEKIATSINVPWNKADISTAHRLAGNVRERDPNIVARFVSRSTRATWLTAAKQKRGLNAIHLSSSFVSSPIYVNEHLTAHTKAVLGEAKRMVRAQQLAFAWAKEGRVLVKASPDARPRRVNDIGDLRKLLGGPRVDGSTKGNRKESHATP